LSACGGNAAIGHRVEANHCSGDRMRCGDFGDFVCGAPAVERQKDRESVGKPLSQCHRHRWVHRAKSTEQNMLLVSQLAQL